MTAPILTDVVGVPVTITRRDQLTGTVTFDPPYLGGVVGGAVGVIPIRWSVPNTRWENVNTGGQLQVPAARDDVDGVAAPEGAVIVELHWVDEQAVRQGTRLTFRPEANAAGVLDLTATQNPKRYLPTLDLQEAFEAIKGAPAAVLAAEGMIGTLQAQADGLAALSALLPPALAEADQARDTALAAINRVPWSGTAATIPGTPGIYQLTATGETYERLSGGGLQYRPNLEVVSRANVLAFMDALRPAPVPARPPRLEVFVPASAQYAAGALGGQRGWVTQGGTAAVTATGVTVDSNVVGGAPHGTYNPALVFSEGAFTVEVTDAAGGTAIQWGGGNSGYRFAAWKGGGNLEFGWWEARADGTLANVNSKGTTPVPGVPYLIEIISGVVATGSTMQLRVWNRGSARPAAPTLTAAFDATSAAIPEGPIRLSSLGSPAQYGSVTVDNWGTRPNPVSARALPVGPWFPRFEGGVNTLATVTSGSELRLSVTGTPGVALTLAIPTGMTYRPVIAARTRPAGGVWSAWTRTATPTTGGAGSLVRVDPVAGLDVTRTYDVQLVFNVHESDNHFALGSGACVVEVIVGGSGRAWPTADDQRQRILVIGDSITAGIVAGGYAASPDPASTPGVLISEQAYPHVMAGILNALPLHNGYGGTGVTVAGSGGMPRALTNVTSAMDGRAKWWWPYDPTAIIVNHGTNDAGASVASATFRAGYRELIVALLLRFPAAALYCLRPFNGAFATEIAGVAAELRLPYLDSTGWLVSGDYVDGVHPSVAGHLKAGTRLAAALVAAGLPATA